MTERDRRFRDDMCERMTLPQIDEWLTKHPPPHDWKRGPYEWAWLEIPLRAPDFWKDVQ